MGYLFLFIALLAGATKGYCGKKTSGYTADFKDAILANLIRMLLCIIIGLALILFGGNISDLMPTAKTLTIAALSGISTAAFVVTWLISVKKSAYMMLDIFLMLGVLVPLIAADMFFNEAVSPTQWIGLAVLFLAVVIMCSYNNTIKGKLDPSSFAILLACGIANGITDFSQKLFVKLQPDTAASVFNLYTYVFAAITLAIAYALCKPRTNSGEKNDLTHIVGYITVMALCLFANSFFKTLAAEHLSSVLLYPLNQGCALILSTVMSAALFREKITAKAIIGIATAFTGLIIINLL